MSNRIEDPDGSPERPVELGEKTPEAGPEDSSSRGVSSNTLLSDEEDEDEDAVEDLGVVVGLRSRPWRPSGRL
jgi:hypothetical protein